MECDRAFGAAEAAPRARRLSNAARAPTDRVEKTPRGLTWLAFTCLALVASRPVAANDVVGAWLSPPDNNWPLISVHAALTPDGRVLTYGTDGAGKQTGYFIYDVWDPAAGLSGGHITLNNNTLTDIFCSSQVILPQSGTIFLAGGDNWTGTGTTNTGNNNSNLFRYTDDTLSRGNNMNRARWYSSTTVLVNGEVYIQGGSGGADYPEVRDLNGGFRLLTGAPTGSYAVLFPRNFLAPDGRVFGYDTNGNMYYVNPSGSGSISAAGQFASSNAGWTSSAAMFRPGRILQMGGNSNAAIVIDINGPQPAVTATQSMSTKRQWVSATVLADGRVLATGGSEVDNQLTNVNNSAEVWNPVTGQWTVGPSGSRARLYHSGALLLPDASVLVTGGGAPGPLVNLHSEIYYPSYLFDSSGALAARPTIETAPQTIDLGQTFQVGVGSATISRVTLIKSGSVTHSVNMDQRFLELPFTQTAGTLFVDAPVRASDVPPGYYLLFVLNEKGTPSVASIVRINIASNPNLAVDYTPTIGGSGGTPFQLACAADEVVAGVYGNSAGTYVNRVGVQCIRVDQLGRWIGAPVNRSATGGVTGATYTKTCPRDAALSGFRGRSAQYVDQLDVECRSLTATGKVTGSGQFLGAVGGTGGSAQGPFRCGTDNPVYAVYGRSGSWIDNFGVQCRQATITQVSINNPPSITNPGNQSGTTGQPVDLPISAWDADGDPLTFSATGLPPGLAIDGATGHITGTPTSAGTWNTAVSVSDGSATSTANFTWTITDLAPLSLDPIPQQPPQPVGAPATYTATARNALNPLFRWSFGDGSPDTAWSSSPGVTHTFTIPGVFWVTVTATDDRGSQQSETFVQNVHLALTANRPSASTNVAHEQTAGGGRVWLVNQDNDSVSVFDAQTYTRVAEIPVGEAPRTVAVSPSGELWVTNKHSASISIIDPGSLSVSRNVSLPRASQPFGLAFAPTGGYAFVALEATGRVLKLDAATGAVVASADVGPNPRHLSVSGDGVSVYVSRFITPPLPGEDTASVQTEIGGAPVGGELLVLNVASMTTTNVVVLRHSDKPDFENQGSGVPNYLGAAVISPDGSAAWVPSKQDNVRRGLLRNGTDLNFQNTVRAIGSRIDLAGGVEDYPARLDFDNASIASAASWDRYGLYLFVALETSREVAVVDAHAGVEIFRINVGRAPQGLAVSPDGLKLYVNNFMDRTLGVFDLSQLIGNGQWNVPAVANPASVTSEKLSAQVVLGKQLFYDARDTRLARDRYLSCATCHNDGGQDGRVWDLTGFGEGLRNTISLRGRAGAQGFLHWSANFDEVQDFEGQIRSLSGGTGLMSDASFNTGTRSQPLGDPKAGLSADLDALAAYVASLGNFPASPYRNADGTLTADAQAGREVFETTGCANCHAGTAFTDSAAASLHDIGTLKPSSGQRLYGPLTGIDTPTLRDVWATAPYLHNGSAASLGDAVLAHNGIAFTGNELSQIVAYVEQIGSEELGAPANTAPTISDPGAQSSAAGTPVSLQIEASDADGDPLSYGANGLPVGLGIDPVTGLISGTPTLAGTSTVTVTVSDGSANASASFAWSITEPAGDTEPPTAPTGLSASNSGGFPQLSWSASTDNVGVAGYAIYRSTDGTQGVEVFRTSGTAWLDATATEGVEHWYTIKAYDAADNLSTPSQSVSIIAFEAPTSPRNLTISVVGNLPELSWTESTDNVGVVGYIIYRDTRNAQGPEIARTSATTWLDATAQPGVRYTYTVSAYDAAGYESSRSGFKSIKLR